MGGPEPCCPTHYFSHCRNGILVPLVIQTHGYSRSALYSWCLCACALVCTYGVFSSMAGMDRALLTDVLSHRQEMVSMYLNPLANF
jgi:hypothetical protein